MKKFFAILLTLSLLFSLSLPALAKEVEEEDPGELVIAPYEPADEAEDTEDYEPTDYDRGYEAAFETAYDQGYAQGQKDGKAGKITYKGDLETSENSVTYEDGVADGKALGYEFGYSEGYADATGRDYYTDNRLIALGGVPRYDANIMLGDKMLRFQDAVPVIKNSRTMIPARAVVEGLGGTVDYDHPTRTVTMTLNGTTMTLPIGGTAMTVAKGDTTETVTLDSPAYIQVARGQSRTMLPLRALSEAAGYTVLWDETYRVAVLADVDGMVQAIDRNFTRINDLLAAQLKTQKDRKVKQTMTLTGSVTLPAEEGQKVVPLPISMSAVGYTDGKAMKVDLTLNLKDFFQALVQSNPDLLEMASIDLKTALTTDWSNVTATLLLTNDQHLMLQCPLLNTLAFEAPANSWQELADLADEGLTLGGQSMTLISSMGLPDLSSMDEGMTVGSLLAATALNSSPMDAVETLNESAAVLEGIFGDAVAKQSGNSTTWTFDPNALNPELPDGTSAEIEPILTGSLTASPSGTYSMNMDLAVEDLLTMTVKGSGNNDKGTMTFTFTGPEGLAGTFTMTQTMQNVTDLPSFDMPEI